MPKIYRFSADSTGVDSIQSYVDDGRIINIPCATFKEYDIAARALQDTIQPGDGVIWDTLSSLLETTRGDMMLGENSSDSYWDQHEKFFGDKQTLNTYRGAQNLNLRRIKNLTARGAFGIVVCHESEGKDPMAAMKMAVPMVNPAMIDDLIAACSDVFRLVAITSNQYDDAGKKTLSEDDRVLYIRRTSEFTAKFHVDPAKVDPKSLPAGIVSPTMEKVQQVLKKIPMCMCVYGHPGSGKTTLAATLADLLLKKGTK